MSLCSLRAFWSVFWLPLHLHSILAFTRSLQTFHRIQLTLSSLPSSGQLSPENLGKAFNTTTQRALTYYSWFHEKVDFYAKVK
jgi:hypothetical protein